MAGTVGLMTVVARGRFLPRANQVRIARAVAIAAADRLACDSDALILVVDELATNAVVHARTRFTLSLLTDGDEVLVELEDGAPAGDLTPLPVRRDALSGRGLQLVDHFASSWGVRPTATGKVVWAQMPTTPPGAGSGPRSLG